METDHVDGRTVTFGLKMTG